MQSVFARCALEKQLCELKIFHPDEKLVQHATFEKRFRNGMEHSCCTSWHLLGSEQSAGVIASFGACCSPCYVARFLNCCYCACVYVCVCVGGCGWVFSCAYECACARVWVCVNICVCASCAPVHTFLQFGPTTLTK